MGKLITTKHVKVRRDKKEKKKTIFTTKNVDASTPQPTDKDGKVIAPKPKKIFVSTRNLEIIQKRNAPLIKKKRMDHKKRQEAEDKRAKIGSEKLQKFLRAKEQIAKEALTKLKELEESMKEKEKPLETADQKKKRITNNKRRRDLAKKKKGAGGPDWDKVTVISTSVGKK